MDYKIIILFSLIFIIIGFISRYIWLINNKVKINHDYTSEELYKRSKENTALSDSLKLIIKKLYPCKYEVNKVYNINCIEYICTEVNIKMKLENYYFGQKYCYSYQISLKSQDNNIGYITFEEFIKID